MEYNEKPKEEWSNFPKWSDQWKRSARRELLKKQKPRESDTRPIIQNAYVLSNPN